MKAKTKRQPTAADLAAEHVERWYASIIQTNDALMHGSVHAVTFDDLFEEVAEALRQDAREGRDGRTPVDEQFIGELAEMFSAQAGYLIGVQVGLRLRGRS